MLSKVSTTTLANGILIGSILTIIIGQIYKTTMQRRMKTSKYYQEVLQIAKQNSIVKEELGEPIVDANIDGNFKKIVGKDDNGCWMRYPIAGPKSNGFIKYWTNNENTLENLLNITRIEVEFNHIKDKKLLLKSISKGTS